MTRDATVAAQESDALPEAFDAMVIQQILQTHPTTRKDGYHVVLNDFGAHSLDILLYFFLVAPDWSSELAERQKVLLEIVRLAERLGVRFAFPTQTLHVESLPDDAGPVPRAE